MDKAFADSPGDIDPEIHLDQLRKLLEKKKKHAYELNKKGQKMLDRCIEARFIDCRRVGLKEEALELIKSYRV